MTSEKQISANRRNAKKSTGPKTDRGKAASRNNAFKHGLLSTEITVPGEDPKKFAYLKSELTAELDPLGFQEAEIVERMAVLMWRLRRLYRAEAEIFNCYQESESDREIHVYRYIVDSSGVKQIGGNRKGQDKSDIENDKLSELEHKAEKPPKDVSTNIGNSFMQDAKGANSLTKLSRYETSMERTLSRLRRELERLQSAREEKSGAAPVTINQLD